jgi:cell division transport system permease protein
VRRALTYAFREGAVSLWRGRQSAALAMLTIAAGLFVLGFFLAVNANLQRLVTRWSEAAELSVFLADVASREQLEQIDRLVGGSGLAAEWAYVSKADAAARFRQDFPDLAAATADALDTPLPASFDVRLRPDARGQGQAVDILAASLASAPGVADVRYDRRLLERLATVMAVVRGVGIAVVLILSIAAALTVANVVRLAAHARREEIEIMQLVGAPTAYVRGPFVAEGVLQGGGGALLALAALTLVYLVVQSRYGTAAASVVGGNGLTFLSAADWALLLTGGMALGCLGGYLVARRVR